MSRLAQLLSELYQRPAEPEEGEWFRTLPRNRLALESEDNLPSSKWLPVRPYLEVRGRVSTPEEFMTNMLMMPKSQDENGLDPDYWLRLQQMFGGQE